MTPRLARNQIARIGLRRRSAFKRDRIYKRRTAGPKKNHKKVTKADSSSSWICSFTSWTDMKIVRTVSEICTAEFASWTIFAEDFANDDFLGECMALFGEWAWCDEEEKLSCDCDLCRPAEWCGDAANCCPCCCQCQEMEELQGLKDQQLEECMELFAEWTAPAEDDEEIMVEPETHDSLLMAALLSTKESLPAPSAGMVRALSCPDLLMGTLAALLFETLHFHYINERLALPAPPKRLAILETVREMDPPNSAATVSGRDAISAHPSTSSIFNLFSDRVATPIPSLFSIDPTGVPSTASTVSVPPSFWDTSSTVSVTGPAPTSAVSIPSTFFNPRPLPSTTSSLLVDPSGVSSSSISTDPSEVSSTSSIVWTDTSEMSSSSTDPSEVSTSSSLSTLFMDPSSAHSCPSLDSCCSCSLLTSSLSSSSLSSICPDCQRVHSYARSNYDESSDDEFERSRHTYIISSASTSGYESDVDSEPVVLKKMTTTASTQTDAPSQSSTAQMLAECDDMLEKLMEMKKRLKELWEEGKERRMSN